jgi:hypothetical protein
MDGNTKDWVDSIAKVFTGLGVFVAAWNYRTQSRIRKAEWLRSLHEKFYENSNYKEVRRWLDSGSLSSKIDSNEFDTTENDEKFTDFLNFFEFIATLEKKHELKKEDIYSMFEYYLKKLKNDMKAAEWIQKSNYGFENLRDLLIKT